MVSDVDLSARRTASVVTTRRRSVRRWRAEFQEDSLSEATTGSESDVEESNMNFVQAATTPKTCSISELDVDERAQFARLQAESPLGRGLQRVVSIPEHEPEHVLPPKPPSPLRTPPALPQPGTTAPSGAKEEEKRQREAEAAAKTAEDAARLEALEAEAEAIRREQQAEVQRCEEVARQQELKSGRRRAEQQRRLEEAVRLRDDLTRREQQLAERERYVQHRRAQLLAEKKLLSEQRRAFEEKLRHSRIAESVIQRQIEDARSETESDEKVTRHITELERSVAMHLHAPSSEQRDAQLRDLESQLAAAKLEADKIRPTSGRFGSGMNGGTADQPLPPLKPMSETPTSPPPSASRGQCCGAGAPPRCLLM